MNNRAIASFLASMAAISESMATLNALVEDNLGNNPDDINWGHAGTAAHVAAQLNQILAMLDKD